jgi:predicted metal-binding protein
VNGDSANGVGRGSGSSCAPTSTVEICEYRDPTGAVRSYVRYVAIVSLSEFEQGARFKDMCGECPHHGRNFSCPPHSPSFLDHVRSASRAEVICITLPKAEFPGPTPQDVYHACFREGSRLLRAELDRHRSEGKMIAGSGPCLACNRCSLEAGKGACSQPEKRIYSLESLGVNVIGLLKRVFGIDLEWDSDEEKASTVCAVGAAFLE